MVVELVVVGGGALHGVVKESRVSLRVVVGLDLGVDVWSSDLVGNPGLRGC